MKVRALITALVVSFLSGSDSRADYASTILADDPIAYYRFEEGAGAVQTFDSSANSLHSIQINNALFEQPGIAGKAVGFNGDGNILLGLTMDPNNPGGPTPGDYSVETWVQSTSGSNNQVFVAQKDASGTGRSNLWITDDHEWGSFLGGVKTKSGVVPDLNEWHHIVLTVDGASDQVRFYIDGVESANNPQAAGVSGVESSVGNWVLGSHKSQSSQFFTGLLDEVAIYKYRLDDPDGDNDMLDSRIGAHFDARFQPPSILGDFDSDGQLTAADIDILSAAVRDESIDARYDLNNDSLINGDDRIVWVQTIKNTHFGDANLDGQFGTADLVEVFQAGRYEDNIEGNATWATGDWNGDGEFSSADLVLCFQFGGFEEGPVSAVAVPEPAGIALAVIGVLSLVARRHRKKI
jgi:hypothetical protein